MHKSLDPRQLLLVPAELTMGEKVTKKVLLRTVECPTCKVQYTMKDGIVYLTKYLIKGELKFNYLWFHSAECLLNWWVYNIRH